MKLSALIGRAIAPDPDVSGLTADSRTVQPGWLFAALPGTKADGAAFAVEAVRRGAVAVIADRPLDVKATVVVDPSPQRLFAQVAALFFGAQPAFVAGVTGTNGKSSTVGFARQIWRHAGWAGASLGTLGVDGPGGVRKLQHTTPPPAELHAILADLAGAGVSHLAMEVSSHAIAQARADGVRFAAAAFCNITQDHLDFHPSFEAYRGAKLRLFSTLLADDGAAVVNRDGAGAATFEGMAKARDLAVISTGRAGDTVRIGRVDPTPEGLDLEISVDGVTAAVALGLIGAFQAENVALAAGIALASGMDAKRIIDALSRLVGAPGRMERVAAHNGGAIYVDYAHTPDAVATALKACRPHAKGRVITIIGAGGDRDPSKRPLMGAAAAAHADFVIVTDDNPRTEDPAAIRRMVLAGAPDAHEIGDRAAAIDAGVDQLRDGDILLIAGKGHETGQIVGASVLPFDDREAARAAVCGVLGDGVKEGQG